MPRAALLSLHARVAKTAPSTWEDPSLAQVWGPRFSAYVVAARDRAIFTLARLPESGATRRVAEEIADRLDAFLAGRKMNYWEAGHALGEASPNRLRYATLTGRVLIRWEGARRPIVWTVPAPKTTPREAGLELARRYLHVFGPATPASFATWGGIAPAVGSATFDALGDELTAVRTPVGDSWILSSDESSFRASRRRGRDGARLLPSGDAYFLLQGADRQLLVPEAKPRASLWTSRVWPGAVLLDGEIVGTWRRAGADLVIETWRALSRKEREVIEADAASLPLPDVGGRIRVRWLA